jgi:hypothetical protein
VVARLVHELELEYQRVAMKHLADVPAHASPADRLGAAQRSRISSVRLAQADRARPTETVSSSSTTTGMPRSEVDGGANPTGLCRRSRRACARSRRPGRRRARNAAGCTSYPSSACHISLSRCAVQRRGSG